MRKARGRPYKLRRASHEVGGMRLCIARPYSLRHLAKTTHERAARRMRVERAGRDEGWAWHT